MFYYKISWFDFESGDLTSEGYHSFFETYCFCREKFENLHPRTPVTTFLIEHIRAEDGEVVESCNLSFNHLS